jgi:hypothetical protein
LREARTPPRRRAAIIDARFTVVKRRRILGAIWNGALALLCAAALGALAPPAWALIARLGFF